MIEHRRTSLPQIVDACRNGLTRWSMEPWSSMWRLGLRPRSPAAMGFALACVLIATAGHMLLGETKSDAALFAPYYSATLVSALVAGGTAGALAMVLGGLLACWLFVLPEWSLASLSAQNLDSWLLYGTSSLVIIWAAGSYRALLQRLREEEEQRRLLTSELAHRVKNTLANVQAIVNLTLRDDRDLLHKLTARLAALCATNDLLLQSAWQSVSLRDIFTSEFAPYGLSRVHIEGEDVRCSPELAILLSLVVHELTTNAAKYGALSPAGGRIEVSWDSVGDRLDLDWIERCSIDLSTPKREGFGTKLLRSGLRKFDGRVETEFRPEGFRCRISLQVPEPTAAEPFARGTQLPRASARRTSGAELSPAPWQPPSS